MISTKTSTSAPQHKQIDGGVRYSERARHILAEESLSCERLYMNATPDEMNILIHYTMNLVEFTL